MEEEKKGKGKIDDVEGNEKGDGRNEKEEKNKEVILKGLGKELEVKKQRMMTLEK